MLAFLGWNPGTSQELFSLTELVEAFTLERVGKSGAKFDPDKTRWYNQQYLRAQENNTLAQELKPMLAEQGVKDISADALEKYCELMKERAVFVADMMEGMYVFKKPGTYDEKTIRKKWKTRTPELLTELADRFNQLTVFEAQAIETCFKEFLTEKEVGMGAVMPNLRVVLTGVGMGPSLFHIIELLGKEETLGRIQEGLKSIAKMAHASN